MSPRRLGFALLLLALAGVPPLAAFQEPGHEEMIRELQQRLEELHVRLGEELSPEERAGIEEEIHHVEARLEELRREGPHPEEPPREEPPREEPPWEGPPPEEPPGEEPFPPPWLKDSVVIAAIIGALGAVIAALIKRGRG